MDIKGKIYVFVKDYKGRKLLSTSIKATNSEGEKQSNAYLGIKLVGDLKGKEKNFLEGFYYVLEVEEGFLSAFADDPTKKPIYSVVVQKAKVLEKNLIEKQEPKTDDDLPF